MNSACPTCGKAVDPLRAPSVKVIGGRITAFCSPECAGRAATEPSMPIRLGNPVSQAVPVLPEKPKEPDTIEKRSKQGAKLEKSSTIVVSPELEASAKADERDGDGEVAAEIREPASLATKAIAASAAARAALAAADDARRIDDDKTPAPMAARPARRGSSKDSVEEPLLPPYDHSYDAVDESGDAHEPHALPAPRSVQRERDRGRRGRRGRILAASVALIAGGGAVAVLSTVVSPSHPSRVDAASIHEQAPAPPAPPPKPAHDDPATVYAGARNVLTDLFASPSDRVRRVAAIALTRVGDQAALDYLAKQLETESSAILRMQDAFAMARAGDKRGKDALIAGLQSPRRDVRSEAATGLLRLGDKAGVSFMTDLMQLDQNKLSAAGALAQMGDPKALAALRAIVGNAKAPREQHMRALIALALAGQADVAAELRTHLDKPDDDQRVAVARALATVGDTESAAAAAAVLTPELDVESLRVDAAIALRRLYSHPGSHLDPGVWADHLAPALTSGRDTDQLSAAEAALILLGPSTVAEHE